MKNDFNNEKIDKYLDELAEEYKSLLLKKLIENSPNIEELSVSELLRIDSEIKKPLLVKKDRLKRLQQATLFAGVLYALIGICMSLFSSNAFRNMDMNEMLPYIVTIAGVFISVFSFVVPTIFKNSKLYKKSSSNYNIKDEKFTEYQIVMLWRDIEAIANELNVSKEPSIGMSPIEMLCNNKLITENEKNMLLSLLKLRNSFIHGNVNTSNKKGLTMYHEISHLVLSCNEILKKLKKVL